MQNSEILCGCFPSDLDGTEYIASWPSFTLPTSFSYKNIMPPVRNQGRASTCVCQTLTGMLDVLHNSMVGVTGICNNYSIDELYDQRLNKNLEGMQFKTALKYLRHHGLGGQKIANYAMCKSIIPIKQAIVMNGPVAAGLPVYEDAGTKFWLPYGRMLGGHAVTLVGYNKKGFIVRNSWGLGWGTRGYSTITYDDFSSSFFECWTITL